MLSMCLLNGRGEGKSRTYCSANSIRCPTRSFFLPALAFHPTNGNLGLNSNAFSLSKPIEVPMSTRGISRRRFLQSTAAMAAAAPLIVHGSALGLAQQPAASERITLGFIGMGTQGRGLLGRFMGQKDAPQVLAVCDVDTNRRDAARKTVEARYAAET